MPHLLTEGWMVGEFFMISEKNEDSPNKITGRMENFGELFISEKIEDDDWR